MSSPRTPTETQKMAAQPLNLSEEWTFNPAVDFQGYRSKWVKARDSAAAEFTSLESYSTPIDVAFLKRLDGLFALLDFQAQEAALWQNYHPEESIRQEAEIVGLAVEKLSSELASSPILARLLESATFPLDASSHRFQKFATREARRAGAYLDDDKRAKYREVGSELQQVMQAFQKAINDDDSYLMVESRLLESMPKDFQASHPVDEATGKVKITVKPSDYFTFIKYSKDNDTAKQLWHLDFNRAPDNEDRLKRMIELRHQQAKLLGYESYAHFAMETCMLSDPTATRALMVKLNEEAKAASEHEKVALASALGSGKLEPWNLTRAKAQLLKQRFPAFDPLRVREFFPLKNALSQGMALLEKLFAIRFRERKGADVWHPYVRVFALYDVSDPSTVLGESSDTSIEGRLLGNIYVDLITRDNKNGHPYTFPIQSSIAGSPAIPSVALGDCFGTDEDACVDFDHCATLLHELGHCVHFLLAQNSDYYRFNGLNVELDLGEAPSELLEGLMRDPAIVQNIAISSEGRSLPSEYLDAVVAENDLGKAMGVRTQTLYSLFSLDMHANVDEDGKFIGQTSDITKSSFAAYGNFGYTPGMNNQHSFTHLGWYDCRYFSYVSSIVISKDLGRELLRNPVSPGSWSKYRRTFLEPGSSKDGTQLLRDFLGREYSYDAFDEWMKA